MSRKRILATSEAIVYTDPLPIEDLEETTVEDYKTLNEKCDKVIVKIKSRKERKQKPKKK
jgi:hypothetical protein